MGTYTLGTALAAAIGHVSRGHKAKARSCVSQRSGTRVLRGSVEAGTFEHVFFVPPAKGETDRLLRGARRVLDAGRQLRREARAGQRTLTPAEQLLTTLTAASVRVFEEILTLSRLNQGQVFPSYDHLAQATSLGRATVARALKILENIGFLVRQRRFKRLEDVTGPGPRFEQTSNAYRAFLPRIVADYLPRWLRPAPLPQDVISRQEAHIEEMLVMVRSLSCRALAEDHVGGALGKVLARLGAAIDRQERESQADTQQLPNSYIRRKSRQDKLNLPYST